MQKSAFLHKLHNLAEIDKPGKAVKLNELHNLS